MKDKGAATQMFRSPVAVVVWWVWVLFAVGNLIDIAVQGRDHLSVVAAVTLLVITGVVFVTALRPRLVADDDGLIIANPLRNHRVGWAAVTGFDTTDLLRVRCEWPAEGADATLKRSIYAWAVHTSRRRQITAEARAQRLARRGSGRGGSGFGGFGGFGAAPPPNVPPPAPVGLNADHIVGTLNARADQAKMAEPDARAMPPASTWDWPAIATVAVPVLALLIVVLV